MKTEAISLLSPRARSRGLLIFLFVLFFSPLFGAWLLYKSGTTLFSDHVNHGQLINPPFAFSALALTDDVGTHVNSSVTRGKWAMIYVAPGSCDQICQNNLYKMRQIRLELNADEQRMQRVLLMLDEQSDLPIRSQLAHSYFGTLALHTSASAINQLLTVLPQKTLAMQRGGLYLADPLGNVMMVYTADAEPSGIYQDLQRLLRVSQIG